MAAKPDLSIVSGFWKLLREIRPLGGPTVMSAGLNNVHSGGSTGRRETSAALQLPQRRRTGRAKTPDFPRLSEARNRAGVYIS